MPLSETHVFGPANLALGGWQGFSLFLTPGLQSDSFEEAYGEREKSSLATLNHKIFLIKIGQESAFYLFTTIYRFSRIE